ncbi:uncharacterized protein DS421_18g628080 [Arachis hypogaea]|nr:uncharacterized protein DS421_18g628080 [Arachis hypogaea]
MRAGVAAPIAAENETCLEAALGEESSFLFLVALEGVGTWWFLAFGEGAIPSE